MLKNECVCNAESAKRNKQYAARLKAMRLVALVGKSS